MNGPDQGSVELIVLSGVLTDGSPWCQRSTASGSQIDALIAAMARQCGGAASQCRPHPATSVETLVLEFGGLGGATIAIRRSLAVIGLLDLAVISVAHGLIVPRCCPSGVITQTPPGPVAHRLPASSTFSPSAARLDMAWKIRGCRLLGPGPSKTLGWCRSCPNCDSGINSSFEGRGG